MAIPNIEARSAIGLRINTQEAGYLTLLVFEVSERGGRLRLGRRQQCRAGFEYPLYYARWRERDDILSFDSVIGHVSCRNRPASAGMKAEF